MAISHLKTAQFQGALFIFFKQETDTARSSFSHYSCKQSVTSLLRGDRMAFSGSIKARERPCTRGWRKGRTKGLRGREKQKPRKAENKKWQSRTKKEQTFVPLFLLKETEENTKKRGSKLPFNRQHLTSSSPSLMSWAEEAHKEDQGKQ